MLSAQSLAVLSVMGKGKTKELLSLGYKIEYIPEEDKGVRDIVGTGFSLCQRGLESEINLANILSRVTLPNGYAGEVIHAWKDGYGTDASAAYRSAKSHHSEKLYGDWKRDMEKAEQDGKLTEVLPVMSRRLTDLSNVGQAYSPSIKEHLKSPLQDLLFPFQSRTMNDIFRGGLWNFNNIVVSCPSGHGKTTMATTYLSECALMAQQFPEGRQKVVMIANELPANQHSGFLLASWGIPYWQTIKYQKAQVENHHYAGDGTELWRKFNEYQDYIEWYCPIYDREHASNLNVIEGILDTVRPQVLIIENLDMIDKERRGKSQSDYSVIDDTMNRIEGFMNRYMATILSFSQISDKAEEDFIKNDDLPNFKGRGSGGIKNAARLGIIAKKDNIRNVEHFVVKKNSLPPLPGVVLHDYYGTELKCNAVNTVHKMAYSETRMVYEDLPSQ